MGTTKNSNEAQATRDEQNVGIIPAGTVTGRFPVVDLYCAACGESHAHEDQGLRATGFGCGTVHFLNLDELDGNLFPRRR